MLRLCIVLTIGESPYFCSNYSHWYNLLLIWVVAKVSSIATWNKKEISFHTSFFFYTCYAKLINMKLGKMVPLWLQPRTSRESDIHYSTEPDICELKYLKPKVSLQWLSIRFSECWWMVYKNCFIQIKDQSVAHMTIVLWVYFVKKKKKKKKNRKALLQHTRGQNNNLR